MLLIERSNTSCVQLKMSRVKVILVVVMPALFVLVSVGCFGNPTTGCGCDNLSCLLSAQASGKSKSAASAVASTVQRWSRRANVQPGADEFGAPVALAQTPIQPEQTISSSVPPLTSLELIQSWQFLWRTAFEPRAPSLVS